MVARVVSQHVVKLNVINLVGCLRLETLLNNVQLLLAHLHAEIVKDGAEASECDETTSTSVLILEVRLDQQASVLHICAQSLQALNQNFLFSSVQNILRVEDGGCIEIVDSCGGVLFKGFISEDGVKFFCELGVVNKTSICWSCVVFFKTLILSNCQVHSLRVEHTTELLSRKVALAQNVVILEEFSQSDSVLFDNVFDLFHEGIMSLLAIEVNKFVHIGGLCVGGWSMNHILQAVGIIQKFSVLDIIILVSIDQGNSIDIFLTDLEMERVEYLAEDFRGDLEVTKGVTILEEASCIKSVSSDFFTEALNDLSDTVPFSLSSTTSSIDSLGSCSTDLCIIVLLKTL